MHAFSAPLLALVLISASLHYLPRLTRPELFFGVTVARDFAGTVAARRLIRRYRVALWCSTVVALVLGLIWHLDGWAFVLYGIGAVAAAAATHHAARSYGVMPASTVAIDLAAPVERLPGGPVIVALPFAALLALGAWAELHLERLPARLPVHWGLAGPDRWINVTAASVLVLLAQTGFFCLLMAAGAWAVLHWSRRIAAAGAAAAGERHFRRRIVQLLLACEYFLVLPQFFALLPVPPVAMMVWACAFFATILVSVVSMARVGQGGSRGAGAGADPGAPIGDRTADDCWKLGMIYFNRADPALLVEKRMGIGYTLNFGNPWAWAALGVLLAVLVILRLLRQH